MLSDAELREKLVSSTDAHQLHALIEGWQVGTSCLIGRSFAAIDVKPTVVSADVLFEEFRSRLHWEWVAGLGASERRFDEGAVRRHGLVLIWWGI